MVETSSSNYGGIFKSTFLFGFVQIARMLVSLVKNKIIAILLGPMGVGIISIYNNVEILIRTGAGLGISQSAVRDISEAAVSGNIEKFSRIIKTTSSVILFTSLLGFLLTGIFSPFLSKWNFGDYSDTFSFALLSIAVAADIFVDNQLSILKGTRRLKDLAKASLSGSVVALIVGVPLIYLLGVKGIVLSIISSAIATAIVSNYYVRKVPYDKGIILSVKETLINAKPMVKMGFALMISNFLAFLLRLVVITFISHEDGLEFVGFYNAGMSLINTYFSMVMVALTTDYYPRISANYSNNNILAKEIRKQSMVGLIMFFPLMTIFVLFSSFFVRVLYTSEFIVSLQYINVAVIGMLISVVSDCYGYIFIAKQDGKLYLWMAIMFNVFLLPIYLIFYKIWGLTGLGIAYTINNLLQLAVYILFCRYRYNIKYDIKVLGLMFGIVFTVFLSICASNMNNIVGYTIGFGIVLFSLVVSYYIIVEKMKIDIVSKILNIIKKR